MAELFSDYLTYKLLFGAGGSSGRRPPNLVAAAAVVSVTDQRELSIPFSQAKQAPMTPFLGLRTVARGQD